MEVSIGGRVKLDIFPGLLITLEDVHVLNRGVEVASAKEVGLGIDLLSLLGRNVLIEKFTVKNPRIAIETTIKQFNMSQEVAEASTRNLFFSAESGAPFQDGLKALAGMMLANKMLDSEPKWDEFINTSFI